MSVVVASGPSQGIIRVTHSALMFMEEETSDGRFIMEGCSGEKMRVFKMCSKLRCFAFILNIHLCSWAAGQIKPCCAYCCCDYIRAGQKSMTF